MAFAPADVGPKIDLLLNGEGYMYSEPESTKAQFGYTPTFVTRQNVQGDYGDNFQDFWLTATQRDWTLGDGQRFFRQGNEESQQRYFTGTDIDIRTPGQVTLNRRRVTGSSAAASVTAAWQSGTDAKVKFTTSTNLYTIDNSGAITSHGAHGVGGNGATCGCSDGNADYMTEGTGTLRKWNGSAFSTFSAQNAQALAYHNNALYGLDGNVLYRYDTAGTATSVATFNDAAGNGRSTNGNIVSFGGKLLILLYYGLAEFPNGPELWVYDGVGASKLAELGKGVQIGNVTSSQTQTIAVSNGVVYVAVNLTQTDASGGTEGRPAIWYYANGNIGFIWKALTSQTTGNVLVTPWAGGVAFSTGWNGDVYVYDATTGGVSKVSSASIAPSWVHFVAARDYIVGFSGTTTNVYFGYTGSSSTHYAASGSVTTSQFDFDSSLTKIFRAIKVEFETNSGTVDIAYQVDGVGGSYTTLQTGATSGTEYTLSGVTGKTISVKVTLNGNGTSYGPILKRIAVRAAPLQSAFVKNTYVLQLGGVDGKNGQQLRDGTYHPNDGLTQATNLRSVASAGTAVTVVDRFGSYTGVIENEGFQLREYRPGEYVAVVPVRQV